MKQKSGYFSNIKNLIMFVICMLFCFAILVCSVILFVDAGVQASKGTGEYVPNYSFLYVFAGIAIAFVPYLVIYLITVFMYHFKASNQNKNRAYQPSVVVRVKGEGEEIENISRKFGGEVMYNDMHAQVPLYIHVSETHEFTKKEILSFSTYLLLKSIIVSYALLLLLLPLMIVFVLPTNMILFFVIIGIIVVVALIVTYVFFIMVPNKLYERLVNNRLPTSLRVFDDRVEEASMLMDGSEISYVFKYDRTKLKETKDNVYIKGVIEGKEKTVAGLIISKARVEKEIVDYILKKYKNK